MKYPFVINENVYLCCDVNMRPSFLHHNGYQVGTVLMRGSKIAMINKYVLNSDYIEIIILRYFKRYFIRTNNWRSDVKRLQFIALKCAVKNKINSGATIKKVNSFILYRLNPKYNFDG